MGKVKEKCCRSKPKRCANCPVVLLRLRKIPTRGLTAKELKKAVRLARVY